MYIGIDLGGTNIAVGLVNQKGEILLKKTALTKSERDWKEIVYDMAKISKEIIAEAGYELSDIKGVGIGSPGSIDNNKGMVVYANNINFDHSNIA